MKRSRRSGTTISMVYKEVWSIIWLLIKLDGTRATVTLICAACPRSHIIRLNGTRRKNTTKANKGKLTRYSRGIISLRKRRSLTIKSMVICMLKLCNLARYANSVTRRRADLEGRGQTDLVLGTAVMEGRFGSG